MSEVNSTRGVEEGNVIKMGGSKTHMTRGEAIVEIVRRVLVEMEESTANFDILEFGSQAVSQAEIIMRRPCLHVISREDGDEAERE